MTGIPVVRYGPGRLPLADGPGALEPSEWPQWYRLRDLEPTAFPAVRIIGPFEVVLDDGVSVECSDGGWLGLDEEGRPFPISVEEFRRYGRWQPDPEE